MLIKENFESHNISYDFDSRTIEIDDGDIISLSPEDSIKMLKFCVKVHNEIYGK